MKDVYISLGFFLLSSIALCVWAKVGYDALLVALHLNEPGAGGAGFMLGAVWGVIFAALFILWRAVGREAAEDIAKARRVKG